MKFIIFLCLSLQVVYASADISLGDNVIDICSSNAPLIQIMDINSNGEVLSSDNKLYQSECLEETLQSYTVGFKDFEVGQKVLARVSLYQGESQNIVTTIKAITNKGFILLQDDNWYNPIYVQIWDDAWSESWKD